MSIYCSRCCFLFFCSFQCIILYIYIIHEANSSYKYASKRQRKGVDEGECGEVAPFALWTSNKTSLRNKNTMSGCSSLVRPTESAAALLPEKLCCGWRSSAVVVVVPRVLRGTPCVGQNMSGADFSASHSNFEMGTTYVAVRSWWSSTIQNPPYSRSMMHRGYDCCR